MSRDASADDVRQRRVTVAIVGRPNVGKSTLFNRLIGRRRAIVHDQPGVTRDRIVEACELGEGLTADLIDTGGLMPERDDTLGLNEQVLLAVEESDLLVLLVDGKSGPVTADREILDRLRRYGRPLILAVNKADVREAELNVHEFHSFGYEPHLLSAEHGTGVADLREALYEAASGLAADEAAPAPPADRLAIIGRPNVGKSSLLNRLVGAERTLVSDEAGTTRDPVDTLIEYEGRPFLLIDTAGIRRRSKVQGTPEDLAVMMARRQIDRAEAALLVVDAQQGITSGDLAIAGAAWEAGRVLLVAVNKWDLLRSEDDRDRLEEGWERLARLFAEPSRINTSAATGRGVERILPRVVEALASYRTRLETSKVNELFGRLVASRHMPPAGGKPWRLRYVVQVAAGPPTFLLFANRKLPPNSSIRRYLENSVRAELGLPGVPIRLLIRQRERADG